MQLFASSLADIASHFDFRAARANEATASATTAKARAVHEAEARTWASASALLLDTNMEPLNPIDATLTLNFPLHEIDDLALPSCSLAELGSVVKAAIVAEQRAMPTSAVIAIVFSHRAEPLL